MGCSATKPKKQITHQTQLEKAPSLIQEEIYQAPEEQIIQKKQFTKGVLSLTSIHQSTIVSRRCLQGKTSRLI